MTRIALAALAIAFVAGACVGAFYGFGWLFVSALRVLGEVLSCLL